MRAYIEAIILYAVIFLPGTVYLQNDASSFSAVTALSRIFLYNVPSLALIWYLLSGKNIKANLPRKNDLAAGLISLPLLLIIGFIIAFTSSLFNSPAAAVIAPSSAPEWIVLIISCLATGYLEESYFRFYLLSKRAEFKLSRVCALLFSTALFSPCHIYEGPWGFLNSVLCGAALSLVFLRYNSLHGIALAHGIYNIAAYVIGAVSG